MALSSCLITGRFLAVSPDSADAGHEPDLRPVFGLRIRLEPHIEGEAMRSEAAVLLPEPILATTNSKGEVVTAKDGRALRVLPTNDPSIAPVNFTYRVTIDTARGERIADYHISAPANGIVNLKDDLPVAPSTGEDPTDDLEEIEQRVVLLAATVADAHEAAIEAADRAEAAAAELGDAPSLVLIFENGLV